MRPEPSSTRSRAGRWCWRVLVAFGGAVAGTAVVWVLSTSVAAASPGEDGPNGDDHPTADATASRLGDIAESGASSVVGVVPGQGEGQGIAPDDPADDSGKPTSEGEGAPASEPLGAGTAHGSEGIDDAAPAGTPHAVPQTAGRVLEDAGRLLHRPDDVPRMLDNALQPPERLRELGEQMWEFVSPDGMDGLLPVPPLPTDRPEQPDSAGAATGSDLVYAPGRTPSTAPVATRPHGAATSAEAGDSASGLIRSADPASPDHPVIKPRDIPLSPASMPLAPLATPAAPVGSAGGSHSESPHFAVPAAELSAYDSAATGSVRSGTASLPSQLKSQPGVSPD